ncbi:MAG TPA: radical SAM protein [Thermoanaerobaculia bacterium]|jgi:radical SAM superfamily enzyme YgiQ (UPF0313 family)|nr:radical SAM protein [Thermoanaerobaculia bacterium]
MPQPQLSLKPNLLCIVPPYLSKGAPPLGPAALLGYLRSQGCNDFDFLDLRLWVPNAYAPTYNPCGVFGETYVLDVPDLPLVLKLLDNFTQSRELAPEMDERFELYCLERGINPHTLYSYLLSMNRFIESFFAQLGPIDFIGFTVWSSNFLATLMAAAHLKRRRKPPLIVFGGPQTTESKTSAKLALRAGLADFVALGEGEETLLRLYEAFREERSVPAQAIPGTMRLVSSTGEFQTSERPLLRLNNLPVPAFDQMSLPSYWSKEHRLRTVTYELSRGCTDKCTFCSEWVFWKRMRQGNTQHVADGFEEISSRYNAERIWFMDSLLNAKLDPLREFAEEVIRRKLNVKWGGFMRAQMDMETASLLKRAGCDFVFIGVESLSDETLKLMNKRRTEADNIKALKAFLGVGIRHVVAGFIPGFPGDTRERFLKTALVLSEIRREYPETFRVNVEPFIISPGQPLFADLSEAGLVPHKWDERYLDIAPQFRDLTNDVFCHVTGPNQGMERLGEFQIARSVTASQKRSNSPDVFLYADGESWSVANLEMKEIGKGIHLGRAKSESALAHGFILTDEEKAEYEGTLDFLTLNLADSDGHAEAFFNRDQHEAFLQQLEARHISYPSRMEPKVRPGFYTNDIHQASALCLSPYTAARRVLHDGVESILAVDIVTMKHAFLPLEAGAALSALSSAPCLVRDLPALGLAPEFLESLKENGILMITSLAAPRVPTAEAVSEIAAPTPEVALSSPEAVPA